MTSLFTFEHDIENELQQEPYKLMRPASNPIRMDTSNAPRVYLEDAY